MSTITSYLQPVPEHVPLWTIMMGCDTKDNIINRNLKNTYNQSNSIHPERWARFLPDNRSKNFNAVIVTNSDIKKFRERVWYVVCSLRLYYTGNIDITMTEILDSMSAPDGVLHSNIKCPEQLDTRRCDICERDIPPYSMLRWLYEERMYPEKFDEVRWARMEAMCSMIENTCRELVAANIPLIKSMGFNPDEAETSFGRITMKRGKMLLTAEPAYCIPEIPLQLGTSHVKMFYCDQYNGSLYDISMTNKYYSHKDGTLAPVWFARGLLAPLGDKIMTDVHLKWRE